MARRRRDPIEALAEHLLAARIEEVDHELSREELWGLAVDAYLLSHPAWTLLRKAEFIARAAGLSGAAGSPAAQSCPPEPVPEPEPAWRSSPFMLPFRSQEGFYDAEADA